MGTSTSSKGPQGGISFDPPWLDQIVNKIQSDNSDVSNQILNQEQTEEGSNDEIRLVAPRARFSSSKTAIKEYIKHGGRSNFSKVAGSYSKTGMGGAKKLSSRMKVATTVGSNLFGLIQNIKNIPSIQNWLSGLNGRVPNFKELEHHIINILISDGGSLDEDSCRDSLSKAMSDLFEVNPDVDLLNIQNEDIWFLIEHFLASECLNRLCTDVGQIFESSNYKPETVVQRIEEMKSYLESDLKSNLESLRTNLANPTNQDIKNILDKSLENTFLVYEGMI